MTNEEIKGLCYVATFGGDDGKEYKVYDIDKCIELLRRKVDQEREDGELLAYNCEKRARKEIIEKAVKWLEKDFEECRFDNHVYDYCIDDFDEYIAGFRKAMTEQ